MTERYFSDEQPPCLSQLEIRSLANRAVLHGELYDVDYPDEQRQDAPRPHRYVLKLDPTPLQAYKQRQTSSNFETITNVELEYAEAQVIEAGEAPLEPEVRLMIVSRIASEFDARWVVNKDAIYHLPLAAEGSCFVTETYYDEKGRINFTSGRGEDTMTDLMAVLQQLQDEERPMTDEDLQLLRTVV